MILHFSKDINKLEEKMSERLSGEDKTLFLDFCNAYGELMGERDVYKRQVLLLMGILWLTIVGANVPSQLLGDALFWFQDQLSAWFLALNPPRWLHDMLILGGYRTLAWVVSVMLPPMAIFFPLSLIHI